MPLHGNTGIKLYLVAKVRVSDLDMAVTWDDKQIRILSSTGKIIGTGQKRKLSWDGSGVYCSAGAAGEDPTRQRSQRLG
jgi:hypothetical protein